MAHFVSSYGLPLLFLVVALEAAGLPLPGETTLIAAAALAAHGDLSLTAVIVVGALAAIVGDNAGYWLGRRGGRALIARWPWLARLAERVLPRSERFFARHGAKAVILARFLPVLRVTGAWMAGLSEMRWWRFLLWNAVGSTLWAASVGLLTFYAGQAAMDAIAGYGLYGALAAAALAAAVAVAWHLTTRRLAERVERAPSSVAPDEQTPARTLTRVALPTQLRRPLALVAAALLAFVSLTVEVAAGGGPSWDSGLLRETHSLASPQLDKAMLFIADIGSVTSVALFALIVIAILILRRRYRLVVFLGLAVAGSGLSPLLKAAIARPRPALWPRLEAAHSFSYPSGHALASALLIVALCALVWRTRWRWLAVAIGCLFVVAVGCSRVYLGVHYPTDVVASWSLALAWVGALQLLLARLGLAPTRGHA